MESDFSQKLKKWYIENKRNLPWRHEKSAYKIWLSEIILQQTQVVQGLSYYIKFIENFPDIKSLAAAPEDKILKLWQGLGYYSRARNLHAAAKFVVENHKGEFPKTYTEILKLKGVGDYTAAAIASFAYNLPHAVVDGNVYRVLSRVFGIETPIDSSKGKKEFQELADKLLDKKNPATYNQAIMEFGSQYCKPQNPDCENCVLKEKCFAFQNARVSEFPIKAKKTKIKNRYFNYVVLIDKNKNVLINKRSAKDIWRGLYEFYLIESEKELNTEQVLKQKEVKTVCKSKINLTHVSKQYKHVLSHQHLYAKFYVINVSFVFKKTQIVVPLRKMDKLAFPRLIEKFLNEVDL